MGTTWQYPTRPQALFIFSIPPIQRQSRLSSQVLRLRSPSIPAELQSATPGTSTTGFIIGETGAYQFFKLNTNNGAIINYPLNAPGAGQSDEYLGELISSDNSRVFLNELGIIHYIDTATDKLVQANIYIPCCYGNYDLALSSNQGRLEGTGYFYDVNLNAESFYTENDREVLNISYVYGAKLSPDGRLFFQPSTSGIDVFDGYLGNLLNRISLPVALSPNYDALVDDGTDNILVAITGTGNGIAIVDLTSISEPPQLPYSSRKSASRSVSLISRTI
jgi:hypothetical protein